MLLVHGLRVVNNEVLDAAQIAPEDWAEVYLSCFHRNRESLLRDGRYLCSEREGHVNNRRRDNRLQSRGNGNSNEKEYIKLLTSERKKIDDFNG